MTAPVAFCHRCARGLVCPGCQGTDVTRKHAIPALRELAAKRCHKSNCGTVCLCGPCHARKALETLDPDWRP